jgi:hypothetical protein
LKAHPREIVVAEKLHAMVALGMLLVEAEFSCAGEIRNRWMAPCRTAAALQALVVGIQIGRIDRLSGVAAVLGRQ